MRGLDPTTGTGELRGSSDNQVELVGNVVNLGRPAILVRGVALRPDGGVGVLSTVEPIAIGSGQAGQFIINVEPLVLSLKLADVSTLNRSWLGKVELALWFDSNETSHQTARQFLEMKIEWSRVVYARQMTAVESNDLQREELPGRQ